MTIIHVACSADTRFIPDCAVMLHSLFKANLGETLAVHFLHDGSLVARDMDGLAELARNAGAIFSPVMVTPAMARDFPRTERFGLNAWYRVLLPDLLPVISRILYLDSDLLILGPVRPLWEIDLGECLLAAVTQPVPDDMVPRIQNTLGLPRRGDYFNSGVMLLDLEGLRRARIATRVVEFIREGRAPMPWADQDPLNAILTGRRLVLHPRWNVMTPMFETPDRLPPFTPEELSEAVTDPEIIHFIGEYKPLHYRCRHPYRERYFEHLRQTRWHDQSVHGRSLRHIMLRPLPWVWQHRVESVLVRGTQRLKSLWRRARVGS